MEIVDPVACSSHILSCELSAPLISPTACTDREGGCFIIGGINSKTLWENENVSQIDTTKGVLTVVGKIHRRRDYTYGGDSPDTVLLDAISLADHSILISGGTTTAPASMYSEFREDAEIIVPSM